CRTLADVEAAQRDLLNYVVLDPACGSGNFLYVAYRELRRIEAELRRRAAEMRRSAGLRAQETLAPRRYRPPRGDLRRPADRVDHALQRGRRRRLLGPAQTPPRPRRRGGGLLRLV